MSNDPNADYAISSMIGQMKENAYKEREVILWGEIDDNQELIVNRMLERIADKDIRNNEKKPIRMSISSPGGSVFSCLSIISQIETLKDEGFPIHICSYGSCMSAALFIYMTGSRRLAQRHTRFMLHHPGMGTVMPTFYSLEASKRLYEDLDQLWLRLKNLMIQYTRAEKSFLDKISSHDFDYYFFPEKGVELGIVDQII